MFTESLEKSIEVESIGNLFVHHPYAFIFFTIFPSTHFVSKAFNSFSVDDCLYNEIVGTFYKLRIWPQINWLFKVWSSFCGEDPCLKLDFLVTPLIVLFIIKS